jgi:hypothetical protein
LAEKSLQTTLINRRQVDKLKPIIDELTPKLNAYLNSIGNVPPAKNASKRKRTTAIKQRTTDN